MSIMKGVVCAIVSPFDESEEEVDHVSLGRVCEFLIEYGVDAVMVCGTNGEGNYLSDEERIAVLRTVITESRDRIPVVLQAGLLTTADTIKLISSARKLGASAFTVLVPYFFILDDESLFQHFKRISEEHKDIPIYIYNIPSHTGNDLGPLLAARIANLFPNFQGVKYSNCDLRTLSEYITTLPSHDVFVGCDSIYLDALLAGARGTVSGTVMPFPKEFIRLQESYDSHKIQQANDEQRSIRKLLSRVESFPLIPAYKQLLFWKGLISTPAVRSPLRRLTDSELSKLREVFEMYWREGV